MCAYVSLKIFKFKRMSKIREQILNLARTELSVVSRAKKSLKKLRKVYIFH